MAKRTREQVDHLNNQAWAVMLQDPAKAEQFAEYAQHLAARDSYEPGIADSHLNLAWVSIYLSNYEQTEDHLNEAERIYAGVDHREGEAKVANARGVVAQQRSDYDAALEYYRESLLIARTENLLTRQLSALNNIGEVHLEMGHLPEAEQYFSQALELLERLNESGRGHDMPEAYGVVLTNLGDVRIREGNLDQAETLLQTALADARKNQDAVSEAEAISLLGVVAAENGDLEKAEEYQNQSLQISRRIQNLLKRCGAVLRLADVYRRLGKSETALSFYREALDAAEKVGSRFYQFRIYRRLSDTLEVLGRYDQALDYLKRYSDVRARLLSESAAQRVKNLNERLEADQLRVANERLNAVQEVARDITASLDLDDILARIHSRINRILDAYVFAIALYDAESGKIEYRLAIEEGSRLEPFNVSIDSETSFAAYAIRTGKPIVIDDLAAQYGEYVSGLRRELSPGDSGSLMFFPLTVKDRTIGVMSVQSKRPHAYSDLDVRMIRTLASFVAIAIDNALIVGRVQLLNRLLHRENDELQDAYEELSYVANHDSLTGVANRRFLEESLQIEIERASGTERKVGVLFFDLDQFKPINDRFGHDAGDRVLRRTADRIRESLRSDDTVARIGGDEFVGVVSHISSRQQAHRIAHKVKDAVEAPILLNGHTSQKSVTVTVSVGLALYPDDAVTAEELIQSADNSMYRAKSTRTLPD